MVCPQAGRSFSCPVLDEFNPEGSGAVALPKEMLDSLDAPVTGWCLSATVVLQTRRMVKVELARRNRIPCPDLKMRESMTMVPHLLRRLPERCALPLVRESPGVETGNIIQQGTGEHGLVKPESLATEVLSDVVVGRLVRNGPRKTVQQRIRFKHEPPYQELAAKRSSSVCGTGVKLRHRPMKKPAQPVTRLV